MFFCNNWTKHFRAQLYNFANFEKPDRPRFLLFFKLFGLLAIQCIAFYWGILSNKNISKSLFSVLIILSTAFLFATTAVLLAVYYRERENKLIGFFRYRSTYCLLIILSLLEFVIIVAIKEKAVFVLFYLIPIVLVYCGAYLNTLRKKIEKDAFSYKPSKKKTLISDISDTVIYWAGLCVYWLCKILFPETYKTVCILIFVEFSIAVTICVTVELWLKSIGILQKKNSEHKKTV